MSTQQTEEKCEKCGTTENVCDYWWVEQNNEKWKLCDNCGDNEEQEKTLDDKKKEEEEDSDSDTDSEDKRDGDWYIVRHEECVYDKDGEVSEMDIIYEEEFDHLRDAREMYNEIKVKPYGELVYLDMITCDGEDQDNIDCKGTMKKEEEEEEKKCASCNNILTWEDGEYSGEGHRCSGCYFKEEGKN